MQKLLLLFIACLPFCMQAQSSSFQIRNNVINKIEFDEISLLQIKPTAEGKTIFYFDLEKRLGLVDKIDQEVPIYKNVKGIGTITLDEQSKKISEQFVLIHPEGMERASYNAKIRRNGQMKTVAVSEDFIAADKLTELFPDLTEEMPDYAKEYYQNQLIKKTFWNKTTGFQYKKYTFWEVRGGKPRYNLEENEESVSIYKGKDSKDFFVSINPKNDASDEVRGYVFSAHMPVRDNKAGLGLNEKTMFTFGPDGKIVNQFEMNTKLNTEVAVNDVLIEMENGKEKITGGAILLESAKKKKKKATKKRPNPASVNGKDFYKYDENGKLIKELHLEVDRENFVYFKNYWETNGQDRFLAAGYKPTEFMYYNIDEDNFKKVKTWGLNSKLFQDGKYEEELFKNYEFKLGERTQLQDGKEVVMIEVRGRIQDPRKSEMDFIYVSKGIYVLVLSEDGAILSEHILNRDLMEETAINTEMHFMDEVENGVEWMMIDESGSLSNKELYTISKVTLSFDKPSLERKIFMEKKDNVDWINTGSDFWIMGKTVRVLDQDTIKDAELKTWD